MKYLVVIILAFVSGYVTKSKSTFYKVSCDTEKFGYMWQTEDQFDQYKGFACKDTNVSVRIEKNVEMIMKLLVL